MKNKKFLSPKSLFYLNLSLLVVILFVAVNIGQRAGFLGMVRNTLAAVASVTGEGAQNQLVAFTGANAIGNSIIYDTGTNIGIGTTNPGAKLEVAGQVKITGGSPGAGKVLTSDASGLARWEPAGGGGGGGLTGSGSPNRIPKWSSATALGDSVIYENASKIGIGIATPSTPLHVSGSILSNRNLYVQSPLGSSQIVGVGELQNALSDWPGKTIFGIGWDSSSGGIGVLIPAYSTFGIYGNGGPAHLLVTGNASVYGDVYVKGVRIADYVFEDNYKLKSLEDVELYIKENRHLEGISAIEWKNMGISESNTKLLEKVEELTLYSIGLNKRIEYLEKQLQK